FYLRVAAFPHPATLSPLTMSHLLSYTTLFRSHATDFRGEGVQLVDHDIDGVLQLEDLALYFDGDLLGEIALLHGGGDVGDIAHLRRQVARHEVHVVGEVLPDTADAAHLRLAAELALGANLAGHPGDFRGEGVELIDHGVDGVLELQDLAANVDRDLLRQVAPGDGGRDVGDVAHLGREVGCHQVDVVGEILPDASRPLDVSLSAQLSLGTDFLGDTRDFEGEGAELLDHRVDRAGRPQELTLERPAVQLQIHGLKEVPFGDSGNDPGDTGEIFRVSLVQLDNAVHLGGDPGHDARGRHWHADRDVALSDLASDRQHELGVGARDALGRPPIGAPGAGTVGIVCAQSGALVPDDLEWRAPLVTTLGHCLPVYKIAASKSNDSCYPGW